MVKRGTYRVRRLSMEALASVSTYVWVALTPLTSMTAGGVRLSDLTLVVAAVAWVLVAVTRPPRRAGLFALVWTGTMLLLAIAVLASSTHSTNVTESLSVGFQFLWSVALVLLVLYAVSSDPRRLERVFSSYVVGAAVLAASVLFLPTHASGRGAGLAGHPVEVGGALSVAIAYVFVLMASKPRFLWMLIPTQLLLFSGVLGSEALTGLVAALVGTVVGLLFVERKIRSWTFVAGTLLIAGMLLVATPTGTALWQKALESFTSGLSTDPSTAADGSTLQSRIVTITLGLDRALEHPISGSGFDSSGQIVIFDLKPHNVLVYAWLAGGVIVAVFFLSALIATIATSVVALRRPSIVVLPRAALGPALAAIAAAWASALSGPQLYQRGWLLMALVLPAAGLAHLAARRDAMPEIALRKTPTARHSGQVAHISLQRDRPGQTTNQRVDEQLESSRR